MFSSPSGVQGMKPSLMWEIPPVLFLLRQVRICAVKRTEAGTQVGFLNEYDTRSWRPLCTHKKEKKKRKRKKNVAYCFWRSLTKKYAGRTLFNCSNPCCLIISLSGSCKIPQIQASEMSRSDKHGVNNKIMNAESYYAAPVWGLLVFFGHLSQRKSFFLADWLFAHSSSSKGAFKQVSTRHFYI